MSNAADSERPEFVLPVVPAELGLDPLLSALLHCVAFLDLADDDLMDPDAAGDALEHVGMYVQRLPEERLAAIAEDLAKLQAHAEQSGWTDAQCEVVRDLLYSCGIGDDRGDES
ncbi:MAG TPA: hypothetical protein PKA88_02255 [Polyangiaceae bacterium]|nr:hypothetical protein [Polyangiaceae bacterium]HMR77100.1 hypothetical protein [Polyangiaceae bacterium]